MNDQTTWAKKELAQIMEGNKTRYKALLADSTQLEKVEGALLMVAQHKTHAYKKATSSLADLKDNAFGWVNNSCDLSESIRLLSYQFVNVGDISMLPQ